MAKKCSNCGFLNNPDDAHFCGKCGSKFVYYSNWKLYNAYDSTPVSNSKLRQYRQYEEQVNKSWFINPWSKLKKWWKDDGKVLAVISLIVFGGGIGIAALSGMLFSRCSSDKKLTRIEVNGKYGIGYDKDNLLLPAKFDMINADNVGNQWEIYDPKENLHGLAYVTDDIQNTIDPVYTKIDRGSGHYSLLRKSPEDPKYDINYYEYVAKDGKIINDNPFNALKAVPNIHNPGVFRDRQANSQHQLYSLDLEKIGPTFSRLVECPEDSLFVGENSNECRIYDFHGNQLNTTPLYRSEVFSDGVAWAYLSSDDYQKQKLTVIDRSGKHLFSEYTKKYAFPVKFSEGIGFYKNPKTNKWVAVDKKGMEKFEIDAYSVEPFTMGLAPVYKDGHKFGFVDKQGKVVIPFQYQRTKFFDLKFGSDSTMYVTLDGKEGKLHRNGTFRPSN